MPEPAFHIDREFARHYFIGAPQLHICDHKSDPWPEGLISMGNHRAGESGAAEQYVWQHRNGYGAASR
jgi:hypothetical protein